MSRATMVILGLGAVLVACDDGDDGGGPSNGEPNGGTSDVGADASGDTDGGGVGPRSQCDFEYTVQNPDGAPVGAACTDDSECRFGTCLMPGDACNVTNSEFGFCTRGCDCDNASESRIPDDKADEWLCMYPGGAASCSKSEGRRRHVVLRCSSLQDCPDVASGSGYTGCSVPSTGSPRKICCASGEEC